MSRSRIVCREGTSRSPAAAAVRNGSWGMVLPPDFCPLGVYVSKPAAEEAEAIFSRA